MVEAVEEALGPLDAAGAERRDHPRRPGRADERRGLVGAVIDTNLSGAFYTARPALRGHAAPPRRAASWRCRRSWG